MFSTSWVNGPNMRSLCSDWFGNSLVKWFVMHHEGRVQAIQASVLLFVLADVKLGWTLCAYVCYLYPAVISSLWTDERPASGKQVKQVSEWLQSHAWLPGHVYRRDQGSMHAFLSGPWTALHGGDVEQRNGLKIYPENIGHCFIMKQPVLSFTLQTMIFFSNASQQLDFASAEYCSPVNAFYHLSIASPLFKYCKHVWIQTI